MGAKIAFQNPISNNGLGGIDRRASGGRKRRGVSARHNEGAFQVSKSATKAGATSLVPRTSLVPISDREGAKEFSGVVLQFSSGHLAQAAARTKEAAKAWKEGRSMPSALSLLNMANEIPAVRNWMLGMLGITDARDAIPPDAANALLGGLQFVAAIPGPEGAQARALLAKMGRG